MNYTLNTWKHLFKLDPAKEISDEHLDMICESGTDAVIVGGTDNVTLDGVLDLLSRVRRHTVPCALEISNMDAVTPGFDFYFIPMVVNSTEKKWMMDLQHQAIKEYKDIMDWNEMFVEGYCILNQEAKAFTKTNCEMPDEDDVTAYAYMAERVFHLPIFYMEYSGTYGDPSLVKKVKEQLSNTKLFYGGGIENSFQAREMKEHADTIIVGNSIYTDIKKALKTVKAVNDMD
ncbi:putative glycerol-1-phosphate prenyltransferase [Virgibacillus subterraneus]|uniref:Heptaprenylglyceryl phosphate synthase n=2 Tax=Virgibacillus TaxID=84406 RepID=A0A1H1GDL7_9BACI|nr:MULTISPECIES: heptaprenylglyceryl phosphate synthase [Virgibacillus]SDR11382.1 putative glycerol-1-phosphate prenyltransferase [Virgibacillus salinus]SEQ83055.1 putative glycerol-1-phosphate prenyltransferase [Virgibacillus subterraneus]